MFNGIVVDKVGANAINRSVKWASLPSTEVKLKVCVIGENAVGKTSLIRRYVDDSFSEDYLSTLGVAASRKVINVKVDGAPSQRVKVVLWDIMGKRDFLDLVHEGYFMGSNAIIAVFDMTRGDTFSRLPAWLETTYRMTGPVPCLLVGNKRDVTPWALPEERIAQFCQTWNLPYQVVSARTGEGVAELFTSVAELALRRMLVHPL
jgi:small GTP-binding protein